MSQTMYISHSNGGDPSNHVQIKIILHFTTKIDLLIIELNETLMRF